MTTQSDYGNKILDYLKECGYSCRTNTVLSGIEVPSNRRPQILKILHQLADKGLVGREQSYGGKKFRWEISGTAAANGWDRALPFLRGMTRASRPSTNGNGHVATYDDSGLQGKVADLEGQLAVAHQQAVVLGARLADLESKVAVTRVIEVRRPKQKPVKLKEGTVAPAYFERLVSLASLRRNILLVGPTGCGKTTVAELLAETLGLRFGKVGGSGGLQETHLLGRNRPNLTTDKDSFTGTDFLDCYENGGVCLVDELDSADQNVLIALNPALDRSGVCPLPNRPGKPAKRHADFVCVATANTFGRGATRQYAGRNQLDEATLDRFRIGMIECDFDPAVERAVCPDDALRSKLQDLRAAAGEAGLRRVISTRFLQDAYLMVSEGGWGHVDVLAAATSGWSEDEKAKVTRALGVLS